MTLNNNPLGPRSGHCTVLHAATLITAPVAKMTTIPAAGAVSNANTQLTQRGTRPRCSPCGARSVSPVDTVIACLPSTAGMRRCAPTTRARGSRNPQARVAGAPSRASGLAVSLRIGTMGQVAGDRRDVLGRFTELTRDWFAGTFAAPTAAQEQAWSAIAEGHHTLVIAPTGSGKTLAAFLWAIDRMAHRSEEHTSELQSRGHLVCRLLLEK